MLDQIISVTVMKVSSPTVTDATKKAFPPFHACRRNRFGYRNVAFSLNYPDDRVQNCNTYSCNRNCLEMVYMRMCQRVHGCTSNVCV